MTALLGAALVLAAWCGPTKITGYSRLEYGPYTADGTPILTREPIAAASWDVRMGALADVPGVGTVRIADRGMLGSGSPMPWVDVAVWSRDDAFSLTSVRHVCFRRPSAGY